MAQTPHESRRLIIVWILKTDRVRTQLIVQPRLRQRVLDTLALIEYVPEILDRGGDDAAAARRADDIVEGVVGEEFDDDRGDGAEGPFAGADEVAGGRDVAEGVGLVRDGEVVHLVVHYYSGFGNDEVGAEEEVDGCCQGDGHPACVGGDNVRCSASAREVIVD